MYYKPLVDGDVGFARVDTYGSPLLLQKATLAGGVDIALRGGTIKPAMAFEQIYEFAADALLGGGVWSLEGYDRFVLVLPDRVLVVEDGGATRALPYRPQAARVYCAQAEEFFYLQHDKGRAYLKRESDGQIVLQPLSGKWNGGYSCAFAHGRIFAVPVKVPETEVDGRRFLVAGDALVPSDPERIFEYTEGDDAIAMATELGTIKGLAALQGSQGRATQLLVFTRRGVCAVAVAIPRAQWAESSIVSLVSTVGGMPVEHAPLIAGNDALYRGADGWRSVAYDAQTRSNLLASQPLTFPMQRYLESPNKPSATVANGYVLLSDGGTGRVIVGDALASGEAGASAYAWQGRWRLPHNVHWLCSARYGGINERVYSVGTHNNKINIYRGNPSMARNDACVFVTRGYSFEAALEAKRLFSVEFTVAAKTAGAVRCYLSPDMTGMFYLLGELELTAGYSGAIRFLVRDNSLARALTGRSSFSFLTAQIGCVFRGNLEIMSCRVIADVDEAYKAFHGIEEHGLPGSEGITLAQLEEM